MPLQSLTVHVVPIQVTLTGDTATITCSDSRAQIVDDEIVFTFTEQSLLTPLVPQRVRFIVEDPTDTNIHDNYLNMSSAPPLERLVAWKRNANVSVGPEMAAGHDFEVVAIAFGIPQPQTQPGTAVQIGSGRRRIKIRNPGAPGGNIY